ncbi:MAG: hypothetical protein PHE10_02520 [Kiritimatiellae bacterium]|nr:hypothetical protein [Kiritimatiellia bacterium]
MKLLLDTRVLLWAAAGQLPKKAWGLIEELTFVTADGKLTAYPGAFIKVKP